MAASTVKETLVDEIVAAFPCHQISDVEIVINEVINNIVEHAYQNQGDGPVDLAVTRYERQLHFHLVDCGLGMPNGQIPKWRPHAENIPAAELPEGGFGWHLIQSLAQNIRYQRSGGENHLSFDVTIDPKIQ